MEALEKIVTLQLFKKSSHISLHFPWEQGIRRNPPVPPFEKGGWKGDFKKAISKGQIHTKNFIYFLGQLFYYFFPNPN